MINDNNDDNNNHNISNTYHHDNSNANTCSDEEGKGLRESKGVPRKGV